MTSSLNRLSAAFSVAFVLVVAATGFWGFVRSDGLLARGDNPRRILLERRIPRGLILDRNGEILAETVGPPGELTRHYPYPALSSLLGYISPLYGTTGVEAAFDPILHGDEGYEPFELWQLSTVLGTPPAGRAVRLSLDLGLQQAADTALGNRPGAVVLLDAETGELLALASHPSYDANALDAIWSELINDPRSPLLNRATLGLYQPGGALAPAILAAAIASGGAEVEQAFADSGFTPLEVNGVTLSCRQEPLGDPTLGNALRRGCPQALAELGSTLGGDALHDLYAGLRLFEPPAIGLPVGAASADAAVTDPTLAALGQDGLSISPLQLALVTAAIAEHGLLPAPRLVLETQDRAGDWQPLPPAAAASAALPARAADEVAAWMADGHAALANSTVDGSELAWFTGFAPEANPRYVVAVLLESGDIEAAEGIGREVLAAVP